MRDALRYVATYVLHLQSILKRRLALSSYPYLRLHVRRAYIRVAEG